VTNCKFRPQLQCSACSGGVLSSCQRFWLCTKVLHQVSDTLPV